MNKVKWRDPIKVPLCVLRLCEETVTDSISIDVTRRTKYYR